MKAEGVVEEITESNGVNKKGQDFVRYALVVSGKKYSSFENPLVKKGDYVSFEFVQKNNFRNIEGEVKVGKVIPKTLDEKLADELGLLNKCFEVAIAFKKLHDGEIALDSQQVLELILHLAREVKK